MKLVLITQTDDVGEVLKLRYVNTDTECHRN